MLAIQIGMSHVNANLIEPQTKEKLSLLHGKTFWPYLDYTLHLTWVGAPISLSMGFTYYLLDYQIDERIILTPDLRNKIESGIPRFRGRVGLSFLLGG
jgi:hypothetical protein